MGGVICKPLKLENALGNNVIIFVTSKTCWFKILWFSQGRVAQGTLVSMHREVWLLIDYWSLFKNKLIFVCL